MLAHRQPWALGPAMALACATLLPACSPELNWRTVQLGRLETLLPCKPDSGSRPVQLAGQTLAMEMVGCAAGQDLYTLSRIQARDAAQASALLAALRQATLATVRATAVQPQPNTGDAANSPDIQVRGLRPDGAPVQVRLKWLLAGPEVYQLAVYADQLNAQRTDNLIHEAHIR